MPRISSRDDLVRGRKNSACWCLQYSPASFQILLKHLRAFFEQLTEKSRTVNVRSRVFWSFNLSCVQLQQQPVRVSPYSVAPGWIFHPEVVGTSLQRGGGALFKSSHGCRNKQPVPLMVHVPASACHLGHASGPSFASRLRWQLPHVPTVTETVFSEPLPKFDAPLTRWPSTRPVEPPVWCNTPTAMPESHFRVCWSV